MQAKNRDFSRLFRIFFMNLNYCPVKLGLYHRMRVLRFMQPPWNHCMECGRAPDSCWLGNPFT